MPGKAGRSGGKPTPTRLKLLRGNPGRRPLNKAEPAPRVRLPRPPKHLNLAAKKEWRRAGRFLAQLCLITDIDRAAFAAYCTLGPLVEAEEALKTYGLMLKSPSGFPVQSPYLAVAHRALEQMRSSLSEFGMSPASRARVSALPADAGAGPFEAFLQGKSRPGAQP